MITIMNFETSPKNIERLNLTIRAKLNKEEIEEEIKTVFNNSSLDDKDIRKIVKGYPMFENFISKNLAENIKLNEFRHLSFLFGKFRQLTALKYYLKFLDIVDSYKSNNLWLKSYLDLENKINELSIEFRKDIDYNLSHLDEFIKKHLNILEDNKEETSYIIGETNSCFINVQMLMLYNKKTNIWEIVLKPYVNKYCLNFKEDFNVDSKKPIIIKKINLYQTKIAIKLTRTYISLKNTPFSFFYNNPMYSHYSYLKEIETNLIYFNKIVKDAQKNVVFFKPYYGERFLNLFCFENIPYYNLDVSTISMYNNIYFDESYINKKVDYIAYHQIPEEYFITNKTYSVTKETYNFAYKIRLRVDNPHVLQFDYRDRNILGKHINYYTLYSLNKGKVKEIFNINKLNKKTYFEVSDFYLSNKIYLNYLFKLKDEDIDYNIHICLTEIEEILESISTKYKKYIDDIMLYFRDYLETLVKEKEMIK